MHGRRSRRRLGVVLRWLVAGAIVVAGTAGGLLVAGRGGAEPQTRTLEIRARQYGYTPHRIVVNQGDEVRLRLSSQDVVHGFFLEGHDLDALIFPGRLLFNVRSLDGEETFVPHEEVIFRADRPGKFRYRCSVTCGPLHPFMQGEILVLPNNILWGGLGAALGILLAAVLLTVTEAGGGEPRGSHWRVDLLARIPLLDWFVRWRWFQLVLTLPGLAFLLLFLIAGFWGTPVGNRNIIITFVWILWWFLLITVFLPFGARIWCAVCPFPFFGDWLQRRRVLSVREDVTRMWRGFRRWPAYMTNIWLQSLLFLVLCTFCAVLVTRPVVTAFVLLGLVLVATALAAIYRHRAFCVYVCPVSGFLGLYSMASAVEVRARDAELCSDCSTKACVVGSDQGWGCPWGENPSRLTRNNNCGMCMECIKTCPADNMTLRARPFCSDTRIERFDEAWKVFIMIAMALVYSVTLLGSWGTVKVWADISGMGDWQGFSLYAGGLWLLALVGVPGLWAIAAAVGRLASGRPEVTVRTLFLRSSYLLVPLGLCAWIAFSIPLFMLNVTHILSTMSDPMGWGWNLFGTANLPWRPLVPESLVPAQVVVVLVGLWFAVRQGHTLGVSLYGDPIRGERGMLPAVVVCTAMAMGLVVLFAG